MENDYDVGYCKVPKGSQFKPGQSGNPKGRPRGIKNTLQLLEEISNQKITVFENGKKLKITKKAAMLIQLMNKGAKGDIKAISTLLPILLQNDISEEERQKIVKALSSDDKQIVKTFLENNK
jgi:hypothetical protein